MNTLVPKIKSSLQCGGEGLTNEKTKVFSLYVDLQTSFINLDTQGFSPCTVRKAELIYCTPSSRLKSKAPKLMTQIKKKKSRTKKVGSFCHSLNILHWCKNDFKSKIYTNGDYFQNIFQKYQTLSVVLKITVFKRPTTQ